jgi:hypothetical protein
MKTLLLFQNKTTNNEKKKSYSLEFSNQILPKWIRMEKLILKELNKEFDQQNCFARLRILVVIHI